MSRFLTTIRRAAVSVIVKMPLYCLSKLASVWSTIISVAISFRKRTYQSSSVSYMISIVEYDVKSSLYSLVCLHHAHLLIFPIDLPSSSKTLRVPAKVVTSSLVSSLS